MKELEEKTTLQKQEFEAGYVQYKVSVPASFVKLLGWDKGQKLSVKMILGSDVIVLEADE